MGLNVYPPVFASTTGTGFNLDVGATGNNVFFLDEEQQAGGYSIASQLSDPSMDMYAVAEDGTLAGYTGSKALTAVQPFSKIVVYGSTPNDLITFEYKTTTLPSESGTLATGVAPRLISTDVSAVPNQDDTIIITGENFNANLSVTFTGSDGVVLTAKSINVLSTTSVEVVRPDSMDPANSPYTITAVNPDIPSPQSTQAHKLSNSITSGAYPVWQTSNDLGMITEAVPHSIQLTAADSEGSPMTYSVVSGELPGGLSLNSATGEISGTLTNGVIEQDFVFTVRATDTGNNFLDRQFTLRVNNIPQWVTPQGILTRQYVNQPVSLTLNATDTGNNFTYSVINGQLPTGLSLDAATGEISGTSTSETSQTFTVRAEDSLGHYADREFTLGVSVDPIWVTPSGSIAADEQLQATANSIGTLQYYINSGSLPSGLSLDQNAGQISGSLAAEGTFNFTVRAEDEYGFFADQSFAVTVQGVLVTNTYSAGQSYTIAISPGVDIDFILVGGSGRRGGQGGRVSGTIPAASNTVTPLYLYVAGNGSEGTNAAGGFNGGGRAGGNRGNEGSGGGATHLATASGSLSSLSTDQSSVIAVAGGGGGGGGYGGASGGAGGGLSGTSGGSGQGGGGGGGTQSAGGSAGYDNGGSGSTAGSFGQGGQGGTAGNAGGGGGGGGWYGGGGGGSDTDSCCADGGGGGGGSGYTASYVTNVVQETNISSGSAQISYIELQVV